MEKARGIVDKLKAAAPQDGRFVAYAACACVCVRVCVCACVCDAVFKM